MIADKRTAHNALERQRRENLNTKFQELAHTLPGLQTVRRPSKSMIVTKSLEFGKYFYRLPYGILVSYV
jgi:Helix-loop-helix DNA-binding domain